jgi:hypothetical protein
MNDNSGWTKESVYEELGFSRIVKAQEYVIFFDKLDPILEVIAGLLNGSGLGVPSLEGDGTKMSKLCVATRKRLRLNVREFWVVGQFD